MTQMCFSKQEGDPHSSSPAASPAMALQARREVPPSSPAARATQHKHLPTDFHIALTISMYKDLQVISPLLVVVLVQAVSVYKIEEPLW